MERKLEKIDPNMISEIVDSISQLKYGEVVITVYNSKIVQIEKKEKKRFV